MKVLILANSDGGLYNFRRELMETLLRKGHDVWVSVPMGYRVEYFKKMGCKMIDTAIDRRGANPIKDLKLFRFYRKLIRQIRPDIVLTYTIKPNIYGGLACRLFKIPYLCGITGLGSAIENGGILQHITLFLYLIALKKAQKVFFENEENLNLFYQKKIVINHNSLLPGSGVNLDVFPPLTYPQDNTIDFIFIGRIMKEKGIDEYLEAAQIIRNKYPNTRFHICGYSEEDYDAQLKKIQNSDVVIYHGKVKNIKEYLQKTHCTVLPSYHEGMSNALLESAACARPLISTNIPGCREAIDDGVNGYLIHPKDSADLIAKIERFLSLTLEEKKQMGLAGRQKAERQFSRQIVVDAYLEEIERIRIVKS